MKGEKHKEAIKSQPLEGCCNENERTKMEEGMGLCSDIMDKVRDKFQFSLATTQDADGTPRKSTKYKR